MAPTYPMLKYAAATTSVNHGGIVVRLVAGDPWWADDPFVRARPELFNDRPAVIYGQRPVEQASAAPGEKRPKQ